MMGEKFHTRTSALEGFVLTPQSLKNWWFESLMALEVDIKKK